MSNKPTAIYQDQRIAEEFCNFRCDYCEGFYPTEYSLRRDEQGNLHVPNEWYDMINNLPPKVQKYFKTGRGFKEFYSIAEGVMNSSKEVMNTDVLKLSGGELTVYPGLYEFVEKVHDRYPIVQILSNGSNFSKEDILKYKELGNICFQISLDGVSPEANYAKSHSATITNKVVTTVEELLKNGLGVEINCVLTKHNTDKLLEYMERFKDYENFIIVPRPVRGAPRSILQATKEQVDILEDTIMKNYDKYKKILPPLPYFERLIHIMKTDKRDCKCYIPYFVQSIDGYGNFEMCPIGLLYNKNNNVINNEIDKDRILINSCYNSDENSSKCSDCINQYEMFNLYVDDVIELDELRRLPSLNNDTILEHIKEIKEKIKRM